VSDVLGPREEYLQRLEDLLPASEVRRVRADVDAMIQDHTAGVLESDPEVSATEAERRAVAALGPPERLADEVGAGPVTIPVAVRRSFVRALAVFFSGHLLLSIVLTAAGSESPAIAGLLGPLPKGPFITVAVAVLAIFLIDTGAMLLLFAAVGARRSMPSFPQLQRRDRWTRKDALQGLFLLALLAVIFNVLLDPIFSVRDGEDWQPFLAPDLKALVPYVNVVLGLLAVRHVLTLLGRGSSIGGVAADALAALAGSVLLTFAALTGRLVQMPHGRGQLDKDTAAVLGSLVERVFLLVFVVAALLLLGRFVRQAIHLQRMLRTRAA